MHNTIAKKSVVFLLFYFLNAKDDVDHSASIFSKTSSSSSSGKRFGKAKWSDVRMFEDTLPLNKEQKVSIRIFRNMMT